MWKEAACLAVEHSFETGERGPKRRPLFGSKLLAR